VMANKAALRIAFAFSGPVVIQWSAGPGREC